MRVGVTLNLGGTFEPQEHQPPPRHQSPPPMTSVAGWKSPVPYLFGGLAAVLGLIAFALLILACSYWKLSGNINDGEDSGEFSGEGKSKEGGNGTVKPLESSILVIMAGEEKPTFLATPAASRASSFGNSESGNNGGSSHSSSSGGDGEGEEEEEDREKMIETKMVVVRS